MSNNPFTITSSKQKNTNQAVQELVSSISETPSFALLYLDQKHDLDIVTSELNQKFSGMPWIGCTTSGEITPEGIQEGGMVLMAGDQEFKAVVASTDGAKTAPQQAAKNLAKQLKNDAVEEMPHQVVIVHAPGSTVQESGWEFQIFPILQKELGENVQIVGGSAGDSLTFLGSQVITNNLCSDNGLVALRIGSNRKIAKSLSHGYEHTSQKVTITKVDGCIVHQLDGKKASQRYAELVGSTEKKVMQGISMIKMGGVMPKMLTGFTQKMGVTPKKLLGLPFFQHITKNPFGIPMEGTENYQTIFPKIINKNGSIEFYGEIPEGTELTLMQRNDDVFVAATSNALKKNQEQLDGKISASLVIECAGRKMLLDKKLEQSFQQAKSVVDSPIIGFYSNGEQGNSGSLPVVCNNYSVVTLSFGEL
ncbi:MAG: hypothetical protein ACI86H_000923 [bacterium]|jgi:hypothetical protein